MTITLPPDFPYLLGFLFLLVLAWIACSRASAKEDKRVADERNAQLSNRHYCPRHSCYDEDHTDN